MWAFVRDFTEFTWLNRTCRWVEYFRLQVNRQFSKLVCWKLSHGFFKRACLVFPLCRWLYLPKVVEERLACLVQSQRRAPVAQTAENISSSFDRKVSEQTLHHSLLQNSQSAHTDPFPPPKAPPTMHLNWTRDQRKKESWSDEWLLHHVDGQVKRWLQDLLWEGDKPLEARWRMLLAKFYCESLKPGIYVEGPLTQTKNILETKYTSSWQQYSLMAMTYFSRIMLIATLQKLFRNGLKNIKSSRCCLPN